MAVNLVKGQKIDLTKGNLGLNQMMVGLGWDPITSSTGFLTSLFGKQKQIDCDASVIMLDKTGKLKDKGDIVYFGNLTHASRSVRHMGDNVTGDGQGDDEQIYIALKDVPEQIERMIFVVNIYNCEERQQDFGMIKNAFIRIVDMNSKKELARFNLTDSYKGFTCLEVGEVYRKEGEWKFTALGMGTSDKSVKNVVERYS